MSRRTTIALALLVVVASAACQKGTKESASLDTLKPTTAEPKATSAPPTAKPSRLPPPVGAQGAILRAPSPPDGGRVLSGTCRRSFGIDGYDTICDKARMGGETVYWVINTMTDPNGLRDHVIDVRRHYPSADVWVSVLRATATGTWDQVGAGVKDLGTGRENIVVAYGFMEMGGLSYDVVDWPADERDPVVVVHRGPLTDGSVTISGGVLVDYEVTDSEGDVEPTEIRRSWIRYTGGAFRITSQETIPPEAVPDPEIV